MGLIFNNKEYFLSDCEEWCLYDDSSIADIIDDFENEIYHLLDIDEKTAANEYAEQKYRVDTYRNDIFVGLIVRSIFIENIQNGNFSSNDVDIIAIDIIIKEILQEFPDILKSPASTRFHGAWEGGLIDHSIAVYGAAIKSKSAYTEKYNALNPIFFLFHDLCKCGRYYLDSRNIKNPDSGKWERKSVYSKTIDSDSMPHGPESVARIYNLILKYRDNMCWLEHQFTDSWRLAITYHMGTYGISDQDVGDFNSAKQIHPEILLMHHADEIASQLYGL